MRFFFLDAIGRLRAGACSVHYQVNYVAAFIYQCVEYIICKEYK